MPYSAEERVDESFKRMGADGFMRGWQSDDKAIITFSVRGLSYRIIVEMPKKIDYLYTPTQHKKRTPDSQFKEWNEACKEKWRDFYNLIHSKMVGIQQGITKFEWEFLAYLVTQTGEVAGNFLVPQLHNLVMGDAIQPSMLTENTSG